MKSTDEARVRRMQWAVNLVIAAEGAGVACFVSGTLFGLCWYMLRRMQADAVWMWFAGVACVIIPLVCVRYRLKGRWFSRRDARALLDEQLGLNAALCAREQWGDAVAEPVPPKGGVVIKLRSAPWACWMTGGFALALCGGWLPLPERAAAPVYKPEPPPALTQVEHALDAMEESGRVDEKSLEPFRNQLKELKNKAHNEMYSHAGLETADALKAKASAAVSGLSEQFFKTDAALSMLENVNGASDMGAGAQALKDALQGMDGLDLKPGGMIGRQLKELASAVENRQLSPEQIKELREQLAGAAQELRQTAERCGMGHITMPNDGNGDVTNGEGNNGANMAMTPAGGGDGDSNSDSPISFTAKAGEQLPTHAHRLENKDLSDAGIGDAVGVEAAAPSAEHVAEHPERGGSGAFPSKGGDAVWAEELTPAEQDALRNIFE